MTYNKFSFIFVIALCTGYVSLRCQTPLSVMFGSGVHNSGSHASVLVPGMPNEELLYQTNDSIESVMMQDYMPYPAWRTADIPVPEYPYIGFRSEGEELRVNPIYHNANSAPTLVRYTSLESDPSGDHLFTSAWLDILSSGVTFSDSKLFFSLKCNTSTYPVSSGVATYYSYMIVLVDPDALPEDNPVVYGLMHTVNLGSIISPGLYKITGTGFSDLNRIGNIQQSIDTASGTLLLSCDLADLLADQDFASWYDVSYPRLTVTAITSRITLTGGSAQADGTDGAKLLLLPQLLPILDAFDPVLSNASGQTISTGDGFNLTAQITYCDEDHNFPIQAMVSIDGGEYVSLVLDDTQVPDFTVPIVYKTDNLPVSEFWQQATFRFSVGDEYMYQTIAHSVSNADNLDVEPMNSLRIYPNPSGSTLHVKTEGMDFENNRIRVFNIRGQLVYESLAQARTTEINTGALPAGIYFIKVQQQGKTLSGRFVKVD